jgi:hypothetical protein
MKNTLRTLACAVALSVPLAAAAQAASPPPQSPAAGPDAATLQALREHIRADRKAVVAKNLPLTEAEAKAFWPAYDKCRTSIDAAHRKMNRAMTEYVGSDARMTDAHAKQLVGEILAAEAEEAKARKGCFDRVAKALPGKKAARFFQIETKIDALQRFDSAAVVPLVN